MFGYAVHHVVRARLCIERGRVWQAEYWLSAARDLALQLAFRRCGLPESHGRGFDGLPADVRGWAERSLVRAPRAAELRRALDAVMVGMRSEAEGVPEAATLMDVLSALSGDAL